MAQDDKEEEDPDEVLDLEDTLLAWVGESLHAEEGRIKRLLHVKDSYELEGFSHTVFAWENSCHAAYQRDQVRNQVWAFKVGTYRFVRCHNLQHKVDPVAIDEESGKPKRIDK